MAPASSCLQVKVQQDLANIVVKEPGGRTGEGRGDPNSCGFQSPWLLKAFRLIIAVRAHVSSPPPHTHTTTGTPHFGRNVAVVRKGFVKDLACHVIL